MNDFIKMNVEMPIEFVFYIKLLIKIVFLGKINSMGNQMVTSEIRK